jgi:hypothetical protein
LLALIRRCRRLVDEHPDTQAAQHLLDLAAEHVQNSSDPRPGPPGPLSPLVTGLDAGSFTHVASKTMTPHFLTLLTGRNLPKIRQPREPERSIINEKTVADFTRVVEMGSAMNRSSTLIAESANGQTKIVRRVRVALRLLKALKDQKSAGKVSPSRRGTRLRTACTFLGTSVCDCQCESLIRQPSLLLFASDA